METGVKLIINTWDGPRVRSEEVDAPALADVHAAVSRLDGRVCTEVTVEREDPWTYIGIGGGPELYLVTGETVDEKIRQLTDPGSGGETVALVAGGQLGNYARRDLVTRDRATEVAIRLLQHGDYDPALPWDIQE